jgi:uncharacterized membrane protein YedE/YeeE
MKPAKLIFIFMAGGLFGAGLAISGMTDPARVIGFLDVFGKWDPALLVVMAGATGTYGLGMLSLRQIQDGKLTASPTKNFGCSLKLPSAGSSTIDRRLVIGAAIFGLGWGLGGFCPGPSLANLGALRVEALVFVPAMTIGMLWVQQFFGADR